MEQTYRLRCAEAADMDLIYQWANDPDVRAQSFSSEEIPYQKHQAWFASLLTDSNTQLWIYCVNDVPVGQIRCKVNDNGEAVISYSISAAFRGQGHGGRMIAMLPEAVIKRFPNAVCLVARVKPQNTASSRVFLANGYAADYISYSLPLQGNQS